ncbi:MAG TPA: ClpXP protease specificity-enhancing factor [Rhodoferax sp.]|jgi:stringent starvation protein B|nr:ClpXP protease specificity-enhancing factor [Rhodoferax sp.]HNV60515.1 ClpXP protease specificity-enhancing factor [Rhodoferax sp.]
MLDASDTGSTRPYLIRALYEWCTDNGLTPFIAVFVDETVRVPNEYVKDGEIVLNISFDATSALNMGNEFIEFKGRFGGVARDIFVPVDRVVAIYARENGQGMAFPMLASSGEPRQIATSVDKPVSLTRVLDSPEGDEPTVPPRPPTGAKPSLTRVK